MSTVAERLFPTRLGREVSLALRGVVGLTTGRPVMFAELASASVAPATLRGPVGFVTTIVYVIGLPAVYVAIPSGLVTTRALCALGVSVSVPVTGGSFGGVTMALFARFPVAAGDTV